METAHLGYGLDLRSQLLLDPVQRKAIVVRDEIDGDSQMTVATRTSDPVQVGLRHLGKVKVDNHIDSLDVNASCKKICKAIQKARFYNFS